MVNAVTDLRLVAGATCAALSARGLVLHWSAKWQHRRAILRRLSELNEYGQRPLFQRIRAWKGGSGRRG